MSPSALNSARRRGLGACGSFWDRTPVWILLIFGIAAVGIWWFGVHPFTAPVRWVLPKERDVVSFEGTLITNSHRRWGTPYFLTNVTAEVALACVPDSRVNECVEDAGYRLEDLRKCKASYFEHKNLLSAQLSNVILDLSCDGREILSRSARVRYLASYRLREVEDHSHFPLFSGFFFILYLAWLAQGCWCKVSQITHRTGS